MSCEVFTEQEKIQLFFFSAATSAHMQQLSYKYLLWINFIDILKFLFRRLYSLFKHIIYFSFIQQDLEHLNHCLYVSNTYTATSATKRYSCKIQGKKYFKDISKILVFIVCRKGFDNIQAGWISRIPEFIFVLCNQ